MQLILAADTIVVLNNEVITKPLTEMMQLKFCNLYQAKQHEVITGVVLLQNEKEISFADVTEVEFHQLN